MPSTFFGLNIASSALNAFQTAVNTTANNISNVQTKGYTKQVANRQASDALRVYQKYGTIGTGVTTTSITSIRSEYYDTKYWENQSSVGMFETKLNFLNQIENYFQDKESNEPGFSTIFTNMFNQLNELTSNAGDENVRKNFISQAQIFTSYFHDVSNGLVKLQKDCNDQIKTLVESINSSAQKIAALTKQINSIEIQGGTANELRDQRALIIDELSKIVPVTAAESPVTNSNYPDMYTGGTNYIVKIDGQTLVNNYEYTTLKCVSRENQVWQTDAEGLYDIVWADTGMNFNMNADSMDGYNEENFQGKITSATSSTITIKPSTMNTIETMSMASEGVITIKNKEYYYNSFTAEVDENGKILSYKFEIEANLDANEINNMRGGYAEIGDKIDAMGIPYYMSQMSEFLRSFSERFNAYQKGGQDLNGDPMGAFFIAKKYDGSEYDFADQNVGTNGVTDGTKSVISSTSNSYYQMNALNFNVADASIRDSSIFATTADVTGEKIDAHEIVDAMLKLQSDVKLFRGGSAKSFLQCIISDITIDTQESKIFSSNFTDIASAITNQRLSIAGVDEDEEALDIVKFQNVYNLASRMVQCMSEMYDKLINETGV